MPPKAKKKRTVAKFSVEVDDTSSDTSVVQEKEVSQEAAPVRQVVEVVEEEPNASAAFETIKEDAKEIEDAIETIEEEVQGDTSKEEDDDASDREEAQDHSKTVVESLFTKSSSDVSPEITVVGKRDTSLGVWVGAMLGIALAVGVSLVVLVRGPQTFTSMIKKPTPTPTVTVAPTAAPVTVERKDVRVKVLNGGGVAGAGSKMKTFLEEKGYVVSDVGNTPEYTYTTTDIVVKPGKDAVGELLTADLKAEYSLGSTSATLDSSASYDAEVIVGKE